MSQHRNQNLLGGLIAAIIFAAVAFALASFGITAEANSDAARAAVVFLAVISAALVSAGAYAVFAKPSSHSGKKRKRQIVNGFRLAGGILLGFVLMGALVACSQIAFGIAQSGRLTRFTAFLVVLASLTAIFSLIGHWARHFAGWVGYGVLNGLSMLVSGHLVNNPNISVPRWLSASSTVLAFVSALVCLRFGKPRTFLTGVDKAALMTWVLAFTFAVDISSTRIIYRDQVGLIAMFIGSLTLVAAWLRERRTVQKDRVHDRGILGTI